MAFDEIQTLIKHGDIISLRRELDAGASANLSNQFSWTLLMLAAMQGNTSIGELLIQRGADINAINDFGETALSLAAHGGHVPFIRVLLANGATIDCKPHGHALGDWIRVSSGLPQDKIASILDLISKRALD
jgi:ankyrin repeat protein